MEQTEDAAKKKQLVIAQGDAYTEALKFMQQDDVSAQKEADDYLVSLACEKAEGMYMPDGPDSLKWQEPQPDQNLHVEIAVQDKLDKRFLPGLTVHVQLLDEQGNPVGDEQELSYLWHPFLYHYGKDWTVPGDGKYTAKVRIDQPQFPRHDSKIGNRYTKPVEVEIGPVDVSTGQKPVGPE